MLLAAALCCLSLLAAAPSAAVEAKVHHHTWDIEYQYKSLDCFRKLAVTINGEAPGPTIRATRGDTVVVTVRNKLGTENTGIHWHGIRQIGSPWADGTVGVTQCPILPDETFTYRFVVDRPGTYLYHAHYGMQRVAGLDGMIVVSEPDGVVEPFAYDEERTVLLMDWWNTSVYEQAVGLASDPLVFVTEPQSLLINGRGRSSNCSPAAPLPTLFTAVPGKTYRLRIGSLTSLSSLSFQIEGHSMTVVEADGHYVKPFVVRTLFFYSGETYSLLLKADQDPSRNYWAASNVVGRERNTTSGLAILSYAGNDPWRAPPTDQQPEDPAWDDVAPRKKEQSRAIVAHPDHAVPVPPTADRRLLLLNTQNWIDNHLRWAINGVSLCCLSLLAAAPSAAEAANKQAPPHVGHRRCLSSPPSHRHNQPVNPSRPRPPSPTTSSAPPAARPQQQDQDAVVCLERLTSAGTPYQFQGMAAHPDGSGRAFFYTRDSTKVWLATVPAQGIALELQVDGAPFLDLAAVTEGALIRLVGLELHAEFATNGRLFVSYYAAFGAASRSASSAAAAAAGNGPAPLSVDIGHRLVVAEISAKGLDYAGMDPVALEEVRRIFNSGPLIRHQLDGGQTLLRDGHLYLVKVDDEANNTSSSSQLGAKIIRFNVDDHSVPEIYATVGLRDPRGCSFDSESPSNLYCAGVDEVRQCISPPFGLLSSNPISTVNVQQGNGQVYLISDEAAKATVSLFIRNGRPKAGRAPSIFAGILYRGSDPFLNGRYLYVYGSEVWATVDSPAASAAGLHASAPIPHVRCSGSSPISCGGEAITDGNVSMVQDNSKDAFILASTGIYRLVPPNHCWGPTYHAPPSSWLVWMLSAVIGSPIMSVAFYLIWSRAFGGGGGQPATTNCSLSFVFSCCITNYNGTSVPNNGSGQGGMSCS